MSHQVGLFLFKNDLRLDDNLGLARAAAETDQLICLYCLEAKQPPSSLRAPADLSVHREVFLRQSLTELNSSLKTLGQQLVVSAEPALDIIPQLITQYSVARIYSSENVGYYENRVWQRLIKCYPLISFQRIASHTLFDRTEFPFELTELPDSFSKFRIASRQLADSFPISSIFTTSQKSRQLLDSFRTASRQLPDSFQTASRKLHSF